MPLYVPENETVYLTFSDASGQQRVKISRIRKGNRRGHLGIHAPQSVRIESKSIAKRRQKRVES